MIIQSGNDACIVLAEGIAGSEEQFVEMMNAQAKILGLDAQRVSQLHRLARPGAPHVRARYRNARHPHHQGLP